MCAVQTFFRSFLRHPQLVLTTALIKLTFLSAFLTISSTCGLNDSDLLTVTAKNFGVRLYGMIFFPILMEGFQSNSALDSIKKIDSLFMLLRFNFHFLLQMSTALTEFCRAFCAWVSELAVAKMETSSAYIAILTSAILVELSRWRLLTYCVVCWLSRFFLGLSCVFPISLGFCSSRYCTRPIKVVTEQIPVEVLDEFLGSAAKQKNKTLTFENLL